MAPTNQLFYNFSIEKATARLLLAKLSNPLNRVFLSLEVSLPQFSLLDYDVLCSRELMRSILTTARPARREIEKPGSV